MKRFILVALILMLLPAVSVEAKKKPVVCKPTQAKVYGKCVPKSKAPVFKRNPGVTANA